MGTSQYVEWQLTYSGIQRGSEETVDFADRSLGAEKDEIQLKL